MVESKFIRMILLCAVLAGCSSPCDCSKQKVIVKCKTDGAEDYESELVKGDILHMNYGVFFTKEQKDRGIGMSGTCVFVQMTTE